MRPDILNLGPTLLKYLAEPAARSLVLGCFVAAALGAFRVRSVSTKLLAWRGVLAAALAMPLLALLAPAIPVAVPVPNFQRQGAAVETAAAQSAVVHANVAEHAVRTATPAATSVPHERAKAWKEAASVTAAAPAPALLPAPRAIPWALVAGAAYLAIALFFLARVFIGMGLGKRLERAAAPVDDSEALAILSAASRAASLRAVPRLAESEVVSVPMTLGVRRPVILFPAEWRAWAASELEAVLVHEASHVARRDALVQRLALIHRALFWFSPLAWWLDRHLADLAEHASDEAALASGADRTRYAETLLGFFAALEGAQQRVWWHGVSMAKAGQAEKRVDRILSWRGSMSNRVKKSLVVLLVAVAAPVVVLTASVHPTVYNFQEPAPPPQPQPAVTPRPAPVPRSAIAPITPPPAQSIAPMAAVAVPSVGAVPAVAQVPKMSQIAPVAAMPAELPTPMAAPVPPQNHYMGRYEDWGPRFVIVTKGSEGVTMSGSEEDAEHAKSLRSKVSGDFIWFERDEKSYIIRDQATVDRAKKLWEPQEELGRKQEALGKQQEALGKQQEALGEKMEQVRVKIPDMTADMQALMAKMKELNANGGTQEEIGELQSQIGELQSRVGEIQSDAGRKQSEIGREQGELGRKQGELGRQQGELGRQQGELARQATKQMKELLDEAVSKGIAQPE